MNEVRVHPVSRWTLLASACVGVALVLAAIPAKAELGGTYDSILRDQAELHATLTTVEHPAYTAYVLDMPDGAQVREYYTLNSGVFAIDWSGHGRRPNMQQLLGNYFERFGKQANALSLGHNHALHRVEDDFVLESHCAMRHFTGRAYVPQYLPKEVDLADVR